LFDRGYFIGLLPDMGDIHRRVLADFLRALTEWEDRT
jgi:hypothetical protein